MSWSTSELKVRLARQETGLSPTVKYFYWPFQSVCFFCGSFMLFLSCCCYVLVCVCLLMPCGHLLGKGWSLGSRLWFLIGKLSLSHWYPRSGVVLDCIDSWSLSTFLFWYQNKRAWYFIYQFANSFILQTMNYDVILVFVLIQRH